jgi:hypothetical protein
VGVLAGAGIGLEVLKAPPVLDDHDVREAEVGAGVQQAEFGLLTELDDHARHSGGDGPPLPRLPGLVDAHADQEDDEIAVHLGA